MRKLSLLAGIAVSTILLVQPSMADEASMLELCRSHAAAELDKAADTIDVTFQGERAGGGYAVVGVVASSPIITFQCTLGDKGTEVVSFGSAEHEGCPDQITQENKSKYPACR